MASRDGDQPLPPLVETRNSLFSAGLPPVLSNLVKRIEMAELLPEWLAAYTPDDDDHTKASKSKVKLVTNTQAFGLYVAIISHKQPQRVPDLVGYQALIIDAEREYQGEC